MGQLVVTIHAYDALTSVHVGATVRDYGDSEVDRSDTVFVCTTTFPGTGETDPRQWLIDACVALIESI